MPTILDASPDVKELQNLKEEIERRQITLPPDVRAYLNERTESLTGKFTQGETVTEEDMAFVAEVRMWIEMPENVQEKLQSIESMKGELPEAQKRHISPTQWFDLLHVAESADKEQGWIDETFTFPGRGTIKAGKYLNLEKCTSLTHLPEDLELKEDLYLQYCTSLTHLPENLKVDNNIYLTNCTSLTHLSENFKVHSLHLTNCTSLTYLPDNVKIGGSLVLDGCTALTHLPNNLEVRGELSLSNDLQEQVKKDAKRLKKEGKIEGDIIYEEDE